MLCKRSHKMADDYKKLFLNESKSDVRIIVPTERDTWRFPAHSLILCSASEVLCRLVELLPVDEYGCKSVVIYDLSVDAVLYLLEYIYTRQLPVYKWEDALELLQAARKYHLQLLIDECEQVIFSQMSLNNVCKMAESACKLQIHAVQSKCLQMMKHHAVIVLNSESFLNLSRDNMAALLSSDDLNVADEKAVVCALWKWGKKQCCRLGKILNEYEIEQVLAELLDHVRVQHIEYDIGLPLCLRMRKSKFISGVNKGRKGKRNKPEVRKVGRIFRLAETSTYGETVCLADPRCWEGIRKTEKRSTPCAILSTSHAVYLTGFVLDVVESNASGNVLFISVTDEASGSEIARQECCWIDSYEKSNMQCKQLWHLSHTYLDLPVRFEAKRMYSIRLHTLGVPGDEFPYQAIRQRVLLPDGCVRFTLHSSELIALRKICFICIDENDIWSS